MEIQDTIDMLVKKKQKIIIRINDLERSKKLHKMLEILNSDTQSLQAKLEISWWRHGARHIVQVTKENFYSLITTQIKENELNDRKADTG